MQGVFRRGVSPSLADLYFGPDGAERWWLLHGKNTIVADPERSFGQPIVAEHGISPAILAQAMKVEGSVEKVARLYELRPRLVRDALVYEVQLGLRKAACSCWSTTTCLHVLAEIGSGSGRGRVGQYELVEGVAV